MNYVTGEKIKLGDRVWYSENCLGEVVCDVDGDQFHPAFNREEWKATLESGVLLNTQCAGLVHLTEPDEDLILIERKQFDN